MLVRQCAQCRDGLGGVHSAKQTFAGWTMDAFGNSLPAKACLGFGLSANLERFA
jgi:hypothetical protein